MQKQIKKILLFCTCCRLVRSCESCNVCAESRAKLARPSNLRFRVGCEGRLSSAMVNDPASLLGMLRLQTFELNKKKEQRSLYQFRRVLPPPRDSIYVDKLLSTGKSSSLGSFHHLHLSWLHQIGRCTATQKIAAGYSELPTIISS